MSQWDRFSNAALRAVACVRFRNPTSNKRLGVAVPVFSIAALFALQRTSAWRRFRKSTKRRGIIFQSLFSVSDLLSAVTLTLESSSFRWMLLVAGGGTWAARRSGVFRGKGGHERRALAATFVGLQYTLYYWFRVVEVPVVRFQRTFWNVSVVEKAQLLRRQFRPTFWMTNRHLQTVAGALLADLCWFFRRPVIYEREGVRAFDGSTLHLDWYVNDELRAHPDKPYGDGITAILQRVASRVGTLRSSISRKSFLDPHNSSSSSSSSSSTGGGGGAKGNADDDDKCPGSSSSVHQWLDSSMQFHGLQNAKGPAHWGVADGSGGRAHVKVHDGGDSHGGDGGGGGGGSGDVGSGNDNDSGNNGNERDEEEENEACKGVTTSREEMDNGLPLDAPVVVVLHGIGGTAHDPYVKRLVVGCAARAWRPVVYSYWRLDWMDARDLTTVLEHVQQRYPHAPIFAVAYSAGGHVLAHYLQAVGKATPVVAAILVAPCLDFVRTWHYAEQPKSPIYRKVLTNSMKTCVMRHRDNDIRVAHRREDWVPVLQCTRANILYDRHIALVPRFRGQEKLPSHLRPASSSSTLLAEASAADSAPVNTAKKDDSSRNNDCSSNSSSGNGFNTTRDPLWLMGTSAPSNYDRRTPFPLPQTWTHYLAPARVTVGRIAVTTLVLHAKDDPIVSHDDCYDWHRMAANKHIISVRTMRGGHMGWFDGWLPGINDTTWGDAVTLSFLSAVLEQHAQTNFLVGVMSRALDLQTHLQQQQQEPQDPKAARAAVRQGKGNTQGLHSYGDDDYLGGYNDGGDAGNGGGGSSKGASTTTPPSSRQPLRLSSRQTKLSPGHMARLCSSSDLVWPTTPFLGTEGSGGLVGGAERGEGKGEAPFHTTSAKSRAHRASSLSLLQPLAEGFSHLRHAVATSPSPDSASSSSQSQSHGFFFDHDDDDDDNRAYGGRDDGDGYRGDNSVERKRRSSGSSLPSFPIQLGRGGASANKQLRDLSFDSSDEEEFTTWKGSAAAAATSSSSSSRSVPFRGSTHAQAASSEDGLISEESLTF